MFLNKAEAVSRFGSKRNIAGRLVDDVCREARGLRVANSNGRQLGADNIPEMLKPVIGTVAALESCRIAGSAFDVSKTQANEYSQGDYGKKIEQTMVAAATKQIAETLESELAPIRKLALDKITRTMGNITDNKLEDNSAKTLSEIARNLSSVIRNSTPQKQDKDDGAKYSFSIFAPRVREMSVFEALELGASQVEEVISQ